METPLFCICLFVCIFPLEITEGELKRKWTTDNIVIVIYLFVFAHRIFIYFFINIYFSKTLFQLVKEQFQVLNFIYL